MSPLTKNIDRAYRDEANDYFYRMGGAGRYEGYQDWHPLALTISLALEAFSPSKDAEELTCYKMLPVEIRTKCDGLSKRVVDYLARLNAPYSSEELRLVPDELLEMWKHHTAGQRGMWFSEFEQKLKLTLTAIA